MYVSKKDIEALRQMTSMIQGVIEGGPDDADWWESLYSDANNLYDKALKSQYRAKRKKPHKHLTNESR